MKMWFQWTAFGRLLRFRARPVGRITLVAFLTALIVACGFWWGMATWRDIERMRADVTMDVFIDDGASDVAIASNMKQLSALPGVQRAQFDDGERVWATFSERMRIGGDELAQIVELPHRIRLTMRTIGTTASRMSETEALATTIAGSDLIRVVWSPSHIEQLNRRREELTIAVAVGSSLFLLLLMVSIVYSFRAEVHHAGTDLSVGAVLGAAPSTTAFPHFLVCAAAAVVGSALACLLLAVVRPFILDRVSWLSSVMAMEVLYVVLGVMIALIAEGWLLTYAAAHKSARHGKADRAS